MAEDREPYLRIAAGILVLAILPPIFVSYIEDGNWVTDLHKWQTGLGAYWGALFGLCAILFGALLNFDLNRKRDIRLREQDARSLAAALSGEISAAYITCAAFVSTVNSNQGKTYSERWLDEKIMGSNFAPHVTTPVFEANCDRLGLLGREITREIVITFSFFTDYARIAKKEQTISRRDLFSSRAQMVDALNDQLIAAKEMMQILDAYVAAGSDEALTVISRFAEARKARHEKLGRKLGAEPP